jgi:outer membrane protein TolC
MVEAHEGKIEIPQGKLRMVLRNATADHKAVNLSLQLYTEGQTDFLNVLIAQRSLYTDENAQIQSQQNIATDLIALYKALGGGWEAGK